MIYKTATIAFLSTTVLSTSAVAGTHVFWNVPDRVVDRVPADEVLTVSHAMHVESHDDILERRKGDVDQARSDRKAARKARKNARARYRNARAELRKARRSDLGTGSATTAYTRAERDLMEAKDFVRLQRTRVHAKKERVDLARRAAKSANADLELAESNMVVSSQAPGHRWFKPRRFEKQLARHLKRERRARTTYRQALVDVREARQDHYDPIAFSWAYRAPTEFEGHIPSRTDSDDDAPMELRRVSFALGSSTLDTEALNDLEWNAHVLRHSRDATVEIEGHTDASGSMAFNRELAWDRAESVRDYLMDNGVWDEQIETVAYGEHLLLVDTEGPAAINRRAEFRVLEDPDGSVDGTLEGGEWSDPSIDIDN